MLNILKNKAKQIISRDIMRKKIDMGLFYTGGRLNIGDSMVPWLINDMLGSKSIYSNPREQRGPHLFTIGSILQFADSDSTIWGSGFISSTSKFHSRPRKICALRGPLTAKRVYDLTGESCGVFGDPGLLVSEYLSLNQSPKYKIGIIPHYVDKKKVSQTKLIHDDSVKVCNIETDSIRDFIDDISECEFIISSSLHGIIISESFGIPAVWARFDQDVVGDGFKFNDYYASTGRSVIPKDFYSVSRYDVINSVSSIDKEITKIKRNLIESFPDEFK